MKYILLPMTKKEKHFDLTLPNPNSGQKAKTCALRLKIRTLALLKKAPHCPQQHLVLFTKYDG